MALLARAINETASTVFIRLKDEFTLPKLPEIYKSDLYQWVINWGFLFRRI